MHAEAASLHTGSAPITTDLIVLAHVEQGIALQRAGSIRQAVRGRDRIEVTLAPPAAGARPDVALVAY